ncbi:MAG: 3-deoxy-manno-octulosonate cytidylyltransferase [Flavobacteriales bacterium]|nr:3-deoxy-manno-octulosonate cytidylyltransferase [Crocinitomicaceae bacterium]NBX80441.1 3-deoxy-manno-octulosonate cytidylyltransferase [Flavobacteriales bacterium]NCA20460.1 3-deoxy-manno-octulosonate cytidylyltransferase [Crocinitomicaceae bacterium]
MKVLGVIPARFDSSRFPGKPLIDLKGKTMIQRVYEGVLKSSKINKVIVATDDQRIVKEVLRFGGLVEMTLPSHQSGTDRCAEIAEKYHDFDLIINIQGDEPLVNYQQLDDLILAFENTEIEIATLSCKNISLEDIQNPNRIKIIEDKNHQAIYFSRSAVPNYSNFKGNPTEFFPYLRHIGLYAYRREVLIQLTKLEPTLLEKIESLEQLRWLYHGFKIKLVETTIETPNIDVPEDVEKVLPYL